MAMNHRLMRPRASGAFNPKSISGLLGWWDFSDATTLGPTSSGTGTLSNNGPVKYAADKSGNERHMTQTGADSVAPSFVQSATNGLSALSFDGGDDLRVAATVSLTGQTIFQVLRMANGAAANARAFSQALSSNEDFAGTGHYIPILRNSSLSGLSSYASSSNRAVITISVDTWLLFMSQHTGSEIQNRLNNGTAATYSHTLNGTFAQFRIGGSARTAVGTASIDPWQDRIAETVVYAKSLSDTERNAVAAWLGKKWGIKVS